MELNQRNEIFLENATTEVVSKKTENKNGEKYVDRNKKPYTKVWIKLDENLVNDTDWTGWCSVNDYGNDYDIQSGDQISGVIEKVTSEYQGKTNVFWNYRKPSDVDILKDQMEQVQKDIEEIKGKLGGNVGTPDADMEALLNEDIPEESDDLPF